VRQTLHAVLLRQSPAHPVRSRPEPFFSYQRTGSHYTSSATPRPAKISFLDSEVLATFYVVTTRRTPYSRGNVVFAATFSSNIKAAVFSGSNRSSAAFLLRCED
jgi:hypothetical protein